MPTPNTLFALFHVANVSGVEERLKSLSPALSLKVGDNSWFIITPSTTTTKELSDKIGITGGEVSTGIIVRVENYWGNTSKATWEWITAKMGAPFDAAI